MAGKEQKPLKFWKELKRRNVPRVLAIYAGTAFVILEAADIIFPRWGFPDWTVNLVLYLLILGAGVTVILSWIYDLSPQGIVRTAPEEEEIVSEGGYSKKTRRPMISNIIIAVLIVIIGLLMYPKIFRNSDSPLSGKARSSIAVLPLKIIGGDADLSFFASGLVESLTYMLSKVGNAGQSFTVIPPSEITGEITADEARKKYGVSMVITGSIQMDRTSSRLILNLIDAKDQSLIRSEKLDYTREENLIIQDEVISVMVSMLGLELEPVTKERITLGGSTLYDANELYLIGRGILREGAESLADLDEALGFFDRAIAKDSIFALAYAGKAQVLNLKFHFTGDAQWIDESLEFSRKAVELNDQDAETLRSLANSLVEKGEYTEALSCFERSKAIDSSGYAIYADMAYLYELTGDLDKAETYNRRAVEVDPGSPLTHYYLGTFYYVQSRYEEAISEIEKALELSPGHLTIMNVLGACYVSFEEFDKAKAIFEEIVEKDPTQGMAYQNLGTIYFYQGKFGQSVQNYREASRIMPGDPNIQGALGRSYLWWGKKDQANSAFREAISTGHRDYTCGDLDFATWFALMGMQDSALYYMQKSGLETDPGYRPDSLDAASAYFIGEFYLIMDREPLAITYLESALRRGYGWIEVTYSPRFRQLSGDAEFQEMIERLGH